MARGPTSVLVEPTVQHLEVLRSLLVASGTGGNLTSDARLAALAIEHRATVISYDSDFGRFPGLRWRVPAAALLPPAPAAEEDQDQDQDAIEWPASGEGRRRP